MKEDPILGKLVLNFEENLIESLTVEETDDAEEGDFKSTLDMLFFFDKSTVKESVMKKLSTSTFRKIVLKSLNTILPDIMAHSGIN